MFLSVASPAPHAAFISSNASQKLLAISLISREHFRRTRRQFVMKPDC